VDGVEVADGEAALAALVAPTFDPRRSVVFPQGRARPTLGTPVGESRVIAYTPDRVRLDVQLERPGVVVLADAYGSGWHATLDGARVPVLRANVAFRAVEAPAGRHVIEFVYRPAPVVAGLVCAALAVALACAWLAWDRRPRRARR